MKTTLEIVDLNGEPVPACARIRAGERVVSLSTVFRNPSLAVFDLAGKDVTKQVMGENGCEEEAYPNAQNIVRALGGVPVPVNGELLEALADMLAASESDDPHSVRARKRARAAIERAERAAQVVSVFTIDGTTPTGERDAGSVYSPPFWIYDSAVQDWIAGPFALRADAVKAKARIEERAERAPASTLTPEQVVEGEEAIKALRTLICAIVTLRDMPHKAAKADIEQAIIQARAVLAKIDNAKR